MRLGLQLWPCYPSAHGNHFDTMLAVVRACEQAGLDSVWMPDHFMAGDVEHPENDVPILECFVTLGAIAAATSRIRIGELVVGVPYRNPALLAKMCATLDVVSHGRSIIGLGAAWHEPEFTAYGWPFPPVKARMEMLEEAVQIVDRMLTHRPASFRGTQYSVTRAYNDPMPLQQPRPPQRSPCHRPRPASTPRRTAGSLPPPPWRSVRGRDAPLSRWYPLTRAEPAGCVGARSEGRDADERSGSPLHVAITERSSRRLLPSRGAKEPLDFQPHPH